MKVAATPRPRRGYFVETSRGDAAATTWIFRGDESRRRRGHDVDIPRRRVAATSSQDFSDFGTAVSTVAVVVARLFADGLGAVEARPA